ncbi:hypothetical protein [Frigoriflavimonas asaccharolytica]|uniref:Uncharacterized protein n=1 Tax=Frigoriflavimonas asaccharolytica TaxID=2735899 RepID=A0A8J8K9Z2_9FLAO|nr:hypothetical protein [Frigoriflavimonas asaccharolytica]NRS94171.1 hypothetical protein [Frigoriflavimonas asaccharolytica]
MKNYKKPWLLLVPFLLILGFYFWGKMNFTKFYKKQINSKIVKRKDWAVQTVYFHLENKIFIDSNSIDNFDLKIGDSIFKKENTKNFNVYRKKNGKYKFYKNYTIQ